jgi:hypothetical protein
MPDASVSLGLDANQFDRELAAASGKIQSLGKTLSGALGGLGVGLSVGGIAAALKSLTSYGANIADLSKTYGVSTDALQHFGNAAEKNGTSLEAVANGFKKLELARSKALGGNEELAAAFLQLGVHIQDLQKLDPEQIMVKLASSTMNAADMVKVLGKNALELRPLLAGLADGTAQFGEAIDKGTIAKLKKADDTYKTFWERVRIGGANAFDFIDKAGEKTFGLYDKLGNVLAGRTGRDHLAASPHAASDARKLAAVAPKAARKFDEEDDLKQQTLESIRERAKLSLGELAARDAFGEGAVYRNKYIGGDILKAQQAEREKATIEDDAFAGRDVDAKAHMDRFQQLTSGIGSLRDKDKGIGGLADNVQSIEKSAQQIAKNTGKPFENH